MRIVIFGAAGSTGRLLTEQARAAGHDVVPVTRAVADVTDPAAVAAVVGPTDAVLSAIGQPLSRDPVSLYSRGVANILAARPRRLVVVSSSVMDPRWRPTGEPFFNTVLDPLVNRRLGRTTHDDMRRMEALLRESDVDWTIVRPSGLFDHPTPTAYELAEDVADGLFTARADLAASMIAQLTDDRFHRTALAVITTEVRPNLARLIWREAVRKNKRAAEPR